MTNSTLSTAAANLNGERSPLRQQPQNNGGEQQSVRDCEAGDNNSCRRSPNTSASLNQSNNGDSQRRLFAMDNSNAVLYKVGIDFVVLLTGKWREISIWDDFECRHF